MAPAASVASWRDAPPTAAAAAAALPALEAQLQAAQLREQQLRARIVACAREAAARLPGGASGGEEPLPALAARAAALGVCETALSALARLTALTSDVDASLADADRAGGADERMSHLSAAVDAFCAAAEAAAALAGAGVPPRLHAAAKARLGGALAAARRAVAAELRGALDASGWPPPLAQAQAADGWRAGGDSTAAASAAARVPACAALLDAVCGAACDAGAAAQPSGASWALQEVAAPLREQLALHFKAGGPTDPAARPEWLLAHTLRCAAAYSPHAAALLPPAPGASLLHAAALSAALADGAAAVLRAQVLPVLHAGGAAAGDAWLHLADEARAFDARLAALAGPHAAAASGACRVLAEKAEWGAAWAAAELAAALRQLDSVADDDAAWEQSAGDSPADDVDEDEDAEAAASRDVLSDNTTAAPPHGMRPRAAAAALEVVRAAAARAAQLPHASQQRAFLRDVPGAAAQDFVARAARRARAAAAFGELGRPPALGRVARCVAAARALQDGLEELGEAPQLWALAQPPAARAADAADAPARGGVFAPAVAACSELQQEWLAALAAALAADFAAAAAPYVDALRYGRVALPPPGELTPLLSAAVEQAAHRLHSLRGALEPLLLARLGRSAAMAIGASLEEECGDAIASDPAAARVFAADVDALVAAWRPFVANPQGVFKPLLRVAAAACAGVAPAPAG